MRKNLYLLVAWLLLSVPSIAQTTPSAEGLRISYWVGASFSTFNPDYGCSSNSPFTCWNHQIMGLGPYLDTSSFLFERIGVEGEARFLRWHGPQGMTQDSYLGGPRVRLVRYKGMLVTCKLLFGMSHLGVPAPLLGAGTYFAYAPGVAMDYRVAKRLSARVDYEYQRWPGFKSSKGGSGGLTPNGFSVGFGYALR